MVNSKVTASSSAAATPPVQDNRPLIERVIELIGESTYAVSKTEIEQLTSAFAYVGFDPLLLLNRLRHVPQKDLQTLVVLGLSRGSKFKKALQRMTGPGKAAADAAIKKLQSVPATLLVETGTQESRGPNAITLPRIISLFPYLAYDWLKTGRDWIIEIPFGEKALAGLRANYVSSCLEPGSLGTFVALKVVVWSSTRLSAVIGAKIPRNVEPWDHCWPFVKAAYTSEHFVVGREQIERSVTVQADVLSTLLRDLYFYPPSIDQFSQATRMIIAMEPEEDIQGRYLTSLGATERFMADNVAVDDNDVVTVLGAIPSKVYKY